MSCRSKGACHTCRRRRVKCDLGKPRCQKCYAAGVECLGYDNLILWVDGIASRGKMMGKSFPGAPVMSSRFTNQTMLYDSLLHPWLQRLDHDTRHYLTHFLVNVGNDLAAYNLPSQKQSPFRLLLEFTDHSPALFQIIIAMSAVHMHNLLTRESSTQSNQIYALRAKARAFRLLNQELSNLSPSNYTTLLASLMLLGEFAVLESSDDTWRIHVLAAAKLVRLIIKSHPAVADDLESDERALRSWTITRLILQDAFGSSLSSARANWDVPGLCAAMNGIDTAIRYAEVEHYTACPSPISSLILAAPSIYDTGTDFSCCSPSTRCIFLCIQEFDPSSWTMQLQSLTPANNFTERYHVRSAYKAAATLYAFQVVPDNYSCHHAPARSDDLVDEILHHVSQVSCNHPLFKATIWPIHIAGAESSDARRQSAVLQHIRSLSRVLPWQSMSRAEQVLKDFWRRMDSVNSKGSHSRLRWLAEFRAMDVAIYPA
ncbi:Zn(II)2Cys6 transcription factor [Aspergillus stella-maris]|uniref:Zn(II)2Cys6 transcription factor n=1 Tax=Aspergillus stella-maris TaxID=1810926 RepID=UPI003CCDC465